MSKKTYLILLILCIMASLSSLSILFSGIAERGFRGVNYGALIPAILSVWIFMRWRKAE